MKSYKIKFTKSAERDVAEVLKYIKEILFSDQGARNLVSEIDKKISLIRNMPLSFPTYKSENESIENLRFAVCKNYLLFFAVKEKSGVVEIRRFLYNARNLKEEIIKNK